MLSQASRPIFFLFVFCMSPHALHLPWWSTSIALLLTAWAGFIEFLNFPRLPRWLVNVTSLFFPLAVYSQFDTLLGPEAATPLLVVLAALKLNESRKDRDVVITLFICLLLGMYALLFSQSLLMTAYMICVVLGTTVAFIAHRTPPDKLRQVLQSARKVVFIDFVICIPIFLLFFFMFPRFQTPWGRTTSSPKSTVGFSETFSPGDLASLVQSDEPAFYVEFFSKQKPEPSSLYWRGVVLEKTDGWKWFRTPSERVSTDTIDETSPDLIKYQVYLEPKFEKTLFALENSVSLNLHSFYRDNTVYSFTNGTHSTQWHNIHKMSYFGVSQLAKSGSLNFRKTNKEPDYLDLPNNISDELKKLANDFKNNSSSRFSTARRVLNYFNTQGFQYSFNVPQMQNVDEFLFTQKVGFCEHFSSAFAVLMRAAGVPSRVVIGFQGGTYNPFNDQLLVRDKEAHSWAEIQTEDGEWVRVDPTSVINQFRIQLGTLDSPTSSDSSMLKIVWLRGLMMAQAINSQYTTFLLNYSFEEQVELLKLNRFFQLKRWHMLALVAAIALVIIIVINSWVKFDFVKRDPLLGVYTKLKNKIAKTGVQLDPSDGPLKIIQKIHNCSLPKTVTSEPEFKKKLVSAVEAYAGLRYSGKPISNKDIHSLKRKILSI